MNKPEALAGQTIIVTRPARQSDSLIEQLHSLGARVIPIPLLSIEALREPEQLQRIDSQLHHLDHYQTAIFISQNAAEEALHALATRNISWPDKIQTYAIGTATTAYLAKSGIVATTPSQMNSEGLLALDSLQKIDGTRCLIFRGLGGRETLANTMRQRGAHVEYCELYRRQLPENAAEQWSSWLVDQSDQPVLLCINSIETLNHLLVIDPDAITRKTITLLVPGERVARAARAAGFTKIHVAEDATDQTMVYAACLHAAIL